MLAGCQSSAVTMGKRSSTWYSAKDHYGAPGKPLLLSGPHLHLKLVENGEEAGLGVVMRIWV